jgi:SAM-dependent methyltransferase
MDFDNYAADYDAALDEGLRASGESKEYFARGRIDWLARRLRQSGDRPLQIMDFGCGIGSAAPFLLELDPHASVLGVDLSPQCVAVARQHADPARTRFALPTEYEPCQEIDLAFCNGVFHHIPPAARAAALHYVYRSLRPGGIFAVWENNPWNPGARYVMSRIPFDRDAIMISPPEMRRLVSDAGFSVLRTDSLFFFPRFLGALRGLEPALSALPLGAQYLVLAARRSPLAAR